SDDDESGARDASTWRPRKERYLAHLTETPQEVRLVSAADKLHNARAILADYRVLGDALWARFNAKRDDILWYYRSLVEVFRLRGPEALATELARVVEELDRMSRASNPA